MYVVLYCWIFDYSPHMHTQTAQVDALLNTKWTMDRTNCCVNAMQRHRETCRVKYMLISGLTLERDLGTHRGKESFHLLSQRRRIT